MTEKEELIKKLYNICCTTCIADFILADRRRVVEPLVKYKWMPGSIDVEELLSVVDQTLQNAGITNKD